MFEYENGEQVNDYNNSGNNNVIRMNRSQTWDNRPPRNMGENKGNPHNNNNNRDIDRGNWRRNGNQPQSDNRERRYVSEAGTSSQNRALREEQRSDRRPTEGEWRRSYNRNNNPENERNTR